MKKVFMIILAGLMLLSCENPVKQSPAAKEVIWEGIYHGTYSYTDSRKGNLIFDIEATIKNTQLKLTFPDLASHFRGNNYRPVSVETTIKEFQDESIELSRKHYDNLISLSELEIEILALYKATREKLLLEDPIYVPSWDVQTENSMANLRSDIIDEQYSSGLITKAEWESQIDTIFADLQSKINVIFAIYIDEEVFNTTSVSETEQSFTYNDGQVVMVKKTGNVLELNHPLYGKLTFFGN